MSWNISASGTKDEVKGILAARGAEEANRYRETPEGEDVMVATNRAQALVDALAVGDGEVVSASAYGSHSTDSTGMKAAEAHFYVRAMKPTT